MNPTETPAKPLEAPLEQPSRFGGSGFGATMTPTPNGSWTANRSFSNSSAACVTELAGDFAREIGSKKAGRMFEVWLRGTIREIHTTFCNYSSLTWAQNQFWCFCCSLLCNCAGVEPHVQGFRVSGGGLSLGLKVYGFRIGWKPFLYLFCDFL